MAKRGPAMAVDWTLVEHDLDIVRSFRANLLVIGPDWLVADVLRSAISDVTHSITMSAGDPRPLRLPVVPLPGCTLVLRDIDELDADGQAALFDWLGRANGEQQVVCTGSGLLPSLMTSGEFDPRLFYRLNIVCIDLSNS
jgi:Sigma-54 interaction domain